MQAWETQRIRYFVFIKVGEISAAKPKQIRPLYNAYPNKLYDLPSVLI